METPQSHASRGQTKGCREAREPSLKGTTAYQIGHLSLLRFRHGHERQVSQRTLDAVREAQGAGVEPWNTAEHDKAVHGPTPEGGTTNPMESEPPVSETYDDEGDDERDEIRTPRRTTRWPLSTMSSSSSPT